MLYNLINILLVSADVPKIANREKFMQKIIIFFSYLEKFLLLKVSLNFQPWPTLEWKIIFFYNFGFYVSLQGSLNQCDKTYESYGVKNHYCCCKNNACNDVEFARNCKKKMDLH